MLYIYTHKSFSTTSDKGLRKNVKERKKKRWRNWKIKLNEMGTLNMKQKK